MAINTLAQERASTHRSAFRIRRLKSISAFQSKVSHRDIVIRLSASVHQNTSTHTNTHRYTYKHICGALCSKIHSFAMPTLLKLHVGGAVQQFDSIASMCMYIYTYVYTYICMYVSVFVIFMHLYSHCFVIIFCFICSYFKFKVPPLCQRQYMVYPCTQARTNTYIVKTICEKYQLYRVRKQTLIAQLC